MLTTLKSMQVQRTSAEPKITSNRDLKSISSWFTGNGLPSNIKKSEVMLIATNHVVKTARELQVMLDDQPLKQSEHVKYLGLVIDNRLNWNDHISYKAYPKLKMLNRISSYLSRNPSKNL